MGDDVDGDFVETMVAVQQVADSCNVPILLVGAFARDLLMQRWGSTASLRRTRDVDFGVQVESWESFELFRKALFASGEFQPVPGANHPHKLLFRGRTEVDLVPFGKVAAQDGTLPCWPDDFQQEMNVLGYQEALEHADLTPVGQVPMLSLPALLGLKLLSWNDGPQRRGKDAIDIADLLNSLYSMDLIIDAV